MVGSSQGWIAAHGDNKSETTQVHSLILDDQEEKAFITFGSAHNLAFCYPGRSHGWTLFGGRDYEGVVYSTFHRRLFCITSTFKSTSKLEAWDVGGETPRLDNNWAPQLEIPNLLKYVLYVVCAEHSSQLFVVVRHVGDCGTWVGDEYVRPTVGFEVYKIDQRLRLRLRLMKMKDSLEGLAIFVGSNDPIAVKGGDAHAVGVKPNCIYFGYDERVDDMYDYGVFDYQKGALCGRWHPYSFQLYYQVYQPFWFTPRRHHNI